MQNSHRIQFPPLDATRLAQDQAFFYLLRGGKREQIRFHDYDRIYSIPGLYEQLFYNRLQCESPRRMAEILQRAVEQSQESLQELRVLDLGAGNGMMGEELKKHGVARLVGIDILGEALEACQRDRPSIYDGYYIQDLTQVDPERLEEIGSWNFDALVSVAALGFGDIPREAFATAYNFVRDGGWIAFNIKEDFLKNHDASGFSRLIKALILSDGLDLHHMERYRHRLSIEGTPLYYFAVVGRKRKPIDLAEFD